MQKRCNRPAPRNPRSPMPRGCSVSFPARRPRSGSGWERKGRREGEAASQVGPREQVSRAGTGRGAPAAQGRDGKGTEAPARGGRGERPAMPGGGFRGAGAASPLGGRRRAGVRGGEEVGPGGRGGGRLRGSPPPARPSAAPFCSGCCGDQRQRRRALRREARGERSPASGSQVSAGRRAPLPARGLRLPGPARLGPRGARGVHEAGPARPPRAVTGPAARPARPHPGRSPWGPRVTGDLRPPPGPARPPDADRGRRSARGLRPRRGASGGVPPGAGQAPQPPPLRPPARASRGRFPPSLGRRRCVRAPCAPAGTGVIKRGGERRGWGCRLSRVCFLVSYKGCAK